jgi:hypothetical protein
MLTAAIDRKDWDGAAVILLLSVIEAADKLPSKSLEEMLNILSEQYPERPRARSRKPRRAHR